MELGNAMRKPVPAGSKPLSDMRPNLNFNKITFGVAEIPALNAGFHCVMEARMEDAYGMCRVVIRTDMPVVESNAIELTVASLRRQTLDTLKSIMANIADRIEFVPTRIFPEDGGYRCELKTKCGAPGGGCAVSVTMDMPVDPSVPLDEAVEWHRARAVGNMAEAVAALSKNAG